MKDLLLLIAEKLDWVVFFLVIPAIVVGFFNGVAWLFESITGIF